MTTTATVTRPVTADQHANEARRLLTLIRPEGLTPTEYNEYLAFDNSAAIVAAAGVHATLALVEEQRTANLIAAFERDAIMPPAGTDVSNGTRAAYWNRFASFVTTRLGLA